MSRPGMGAGPNGGGLELRRLPEEPALCDSKHLFVYRPCFGRTTGDNNPPADNNSGDNGSGDNSKGPAIVLGGAPYNLGPSGDGSPGPGGNQQSPNDTDFADRFTPTPEPSYTVITGIGFVAFALFARRRRTS